MQINKTTTNKLIVIGIMLVVMIFSLRAQAEVKHISPYGFIVENRIQVNKTPQQVWQALVNKVDLWWPKDHSWWEGKFTIDARAGGCFCERSGNKSAEHMRIGFVEPNKTLRMLGGLGPLQGMGMNGALDWQISKASTGSEVVLTYKVSGINPDGYQQLAPIVAKVQGMQLNGLKAYLAKR